MPKLLFCNAQAVKYFCIEFLVGTSRLAIGVTPGYNSHCCTWEWSVELAEEQRLIGARVGGVIVTRENAARPLDALRVPVGTRAKM